MKSKRKQSVLFGLAVGINLAILFLLYIAFSFMIMEFNPFNWYWLLRTVYGLLACVSWFIGTLDLIGTLDDDHGIMLPTLYDNFFKDEE